MNCEALYKYLVGNYLCDGDLENHITADKKKINKITTKHKLLVQ